jgi:hypothetical protein
VTHEHALTSESDDYVFGLKPTLHPETSDRIADGLGIFDLTIDNGSARQRDLSKPDELLFFGVHDELRGAHRVSPDIQTNKVLSHPASTSFSLALPRFFRTRD